MIECPLFLLYQIGAAIARHEKSSRSSLLCGVLPSVTPALQNERGPNPSCPRHRHLPQMQKGPSPSGRTLKLFEMQRKKHFRNRSAFLELIPGFEPGTSSLPTEKIRVFFGICELKRDGFSCFFARPNPFKKYHLFINFDTSLYHPSHIFQSTFIHLSITMEHPFIPS